MNYIIRTWAEPMEPIPHVTPIVMIRLQNVPSGKPEWTADRVAEKFAELDLSPEDYAVILPRFGGAWSPTRRLKYPFVLSDMDAWNVPNTSKDEEAIAWWRDAWTVPFVERLDALDQQPRMFIMDTERPPSENARHADAMDRSFFNVVREKFQGVRCFNWNTHNAPVLYGDIEHATRVMDENDMSVAMPWVLHPGGIPSRRQDPDEWYTTQIISDCMRRGCDEFAMWGGGSEQSWDALARVVEVIEGLQ